MLFTFASALAQDADTLDVPQGFETLNLAIEGDTSATGEVKNPHRVYRLERGGFYLLNGTIKSAQGITIRIVAAEGDGPMPILIPAADETGTAARPFQPSGDGIFRGLYVTGIDNLGNQSVKNMFRCDGLGSRLIIDNCFLDHEAQSFVRMNAAEQKLYITNTTMRNTIDLASTNNGRFIDTRSNTQDTILVQNCTLYMASGNPVRAEGGIIKNLIWDHVTVHQCGGQIQCGKAINARITNSLFIDTDFEGSILSPSDPADTLRHPIVELDSLNAPDLATEEGRVIIVKNNNHAYTPVIQAWFDANDTLYTSVLINQTGQALVDALPNMIAENNISEFPEFSDPPDPAVVLNYAQYHLATNYSDENNPDPRADRNGMAALTEDPNSVGPAADEFDFDYPTGKQSYTHAEGGFPLGDLNWFPDKKAGWEVWVKTGVEIGQGKTMPSRFSLEQNYPNPFNPSTTIAYELHSASIVNLAVYNSLGQKVRTLIGEKRQAAGSHTAQWDGLDGQGRQMATGVYLYRLEADRQVQSKKMLLMK